MSYIIDTKRCNGCGACLDECPLEAVMKKDQGLYFIDPDLCTDCGSCADICPEDAVSGS